MFEGDGKGPPHQVCVLSTAAFPGEFTLSLPPADSRGLTCSVLLFLQNLQDLY